jgi:hypothetical protein
VAHHQGGEHQERVTQLRFHEPTENALLHRIVFFCPATGLGQSLPMQFRRYVWIGQQRTMKVSRCDAVNLPRWLRMPAGTDGALDKPQLI